jgi:hypothetical protein
MAPEAERSGPAFVFHVRGRGVYRVLSQLPDRSPIQSLGYELGRVKTRIDSLPHQR